MALYYFSLYYFLHAIALFLSVQSLLAGNNETDRTALLEIKAKITHDPFGFMSSWNESIHFCNWQGVSCGRLRQRVTELHLDTLELTGTISPYIGNLSFLRVLDFRNNSLTHIIPPEIGRLHRLQSLYLSNNSIEGVIPSNLSGCYNLIEFGFGANNLVGEIPYEIGYLSRLERLSFGQNHLSGTIPYSLGNISSLALIFLFQNNFDGRIPDRLGKLKNLICLDLMDNNLSGTVPPSIFNLSSLTNLNVGENNLEGSLPFDLGIKLPNLSFFTISLNMFTGTIPASVSNLSELEFLQLDHNQLHGQVPSLSKLWKLFQLHLDTNFLGSTKEAKDLDFISTLANASTTLKGLTIHSNNFTGVFPRVVCNFSMLSDLMLSKNKLFGDIPSCIGNIVNLERFAVAYNQFSGLIPQSIGLLQDLGYLDLISNRFTGSIPSSIGNLTKLSLLGLSVNNLQGTIPLALEYCRNLEVADLSENKLHGSIPPQFFHLRPKLIALSMSNNRLSGALPAEIGQLKNIGTLYLDKNMLSGEIPSSIGDCLGLESLSLSDNRFQGSIPDALQNLKGLSMLDLSQNKFSDKIPKFLTTLQLQSLNLSYNNLEGELPTGGIFNNATAVLILGNSKLCGGIPEFKLPKCKLNKTQLKNKGHYKRLMLALKCGIFGIIVIIVLVSIVSIWYFKRKKKPTVSNDSEKCSNLSYQSLHKATNGFSAENLLGRGAFGTVYKGVLDEDDTVIAIKIFNLENRGASKSFLAECTALRNIRHRNLVKVITACSSEDYQRNDFKAVVYEYMVNGSLDEWLHPTTEEISLVIDQETSNARRSLSLSQRLDIAVDVASAIEYVHHQCGSSVVHCDLKPSNVLLDEDMVAHVSDFGLAKLLTDSSPANQSCSIGVRGTVGYAPPEYGMGSEVSTSGDVYSFGILVLEMFTGKRPTDEIFRDGMSLHNFVKGALPQQVTDILDDALLRDIVERDDIDRDLVLDAMIAVLEVALSCSAENPRERLAMTDAAAQLFTVRNKLQGTCTRQRREILTGGQR